MIVQGLGVALVVCAFALLLRFVADNWKDVAYGFGILALLGLITLGVGLAVK